MDYNSRPAQIMESSSKPSLWLSLVFIGTLLLGVVGGVYLVRHPQIFKSKAAEFGDVKIIKDDQEIQSTVIDTNQFQLQIETPDWAQSSQSFNLFVSTIYAQDTVTCPYNEEPQNCPNGGTRTCQGSDEGDGCHYNPDIDPACDETCNPGPIQEETPVSTAEPTPEVTPESIPQTETPISNTTPETTDRIRISLNIDAVDSSANCEDTLDPQSRCVEISYADLIQRGNRVDWFVPDQEGSYSIFVGFISNKGHFKRTAKVVNFTKTPPAPQGIAAVIDEVQNRIQDALPSDSSEPSLTPTELPSPASEVSTNSEVMGPPGPGVSLGVTNEQYYQTLSNLKAVYGDKVTGWVWQDLGFGDKQPIPIYTDKKPTPSRDFSLQDAVDLGGNIQAVGAITGAVAANSRNSIIKVFGNVLKTLGSNGGTSVLYAGSYMLTNPDDAGESILTLSQAKELLDEPVELLYVNIEGQGSVPRGVIKTFQLSDKLEKLGGLDIEYFPDPDPDTGEERVVILPKVEVSVYKRAWDVTLFSGAMEVGGRAVFGAGERILSRVSGPVGRLFERIRFGGTSAEGLLTTEVRQGVQQAERALTAEGKNLARSARGSLEYNTPVTKGVKLNILDSQGESLIDSTDLIATPVSRSSQGEYIWVDPSDVAGVLKGISERLSDHITVSEAETLMSVGTFNFDATEPTWGGFRLPGNKVIIERGTHRTAAAIRQGRSFQAEIADTYPDILKIRSGYKGEIEARIANGDLRAIIIPSEDYVTYGLEDSAEGYVKLLDPDNIDISQLFNNPDKLRRQIVDQIPGTAQPDSLKLWEVLKARLESREARDVQVDTAYAAADVIKLSVPNSSVTGFLRGNVLDLRNWNISGPDAVSIRTLVEVSEGLMSDIGQRELSVTFLNPTTAEYLLSRGFVNDEATGLLKKQLTLTNSLIEEIVSRMIPPVRDEYIEKTLAGLGFNPSEVNRLKPVVKSRMQGETGPLAFSEAVAVQQTSISLVDPRGDQGFTLGGLGLGEPVVTGTALVISSTSSADELIAIIRAKGQVVDRNGVNRGSEEVEQLIFKAQETRDPTILKDFPEIELKLKQYLFSKAVVVLNSSKIGPRFVDILKDLDERSNLIKSNPSFSSIDQKRPQKTFTEKEGLEDLARFLDHMEQSALKKNDTKALNDVRAFRENLVYVGEKELSEALRAIADRVIQRAQGGQDVVVYAAGLRSERYISLRIMDYIDQLTVNDSSLRGKIRFSTNADDIAKYCRETARNCFIVVPDDFAVSGTRSKGFTDRIDARLKSIGFNDAERQGMIELNLVAQNARLGTEWSSWEQSQFFSYYKVPAYADSNGQAYFYPGVSMTGSHSSTDYGFETVVEELHKIDWTVTEPPLLTSISRPYEFVEGSSGSKYADPKLDALRERIENQYSVPIN